MIQPAAVPIKLDRDEGEARWWLGTLATIKLDSTQTSGRFSLVDEVLPPDMEVPRHLHREQDEVFYLLKGEIRFRIGDETMLGCPGTLIFVPRGTPHSFVATSREPARYLFLHAPGGFEDYVRATSEPVAEPTLPPLGDPPAAEQIAALDALGIQYGMEMIP
jgi:quercetin dioxygenase-like cupin family protein